MKTSLLLSACTLGILASTAPALAASDQLPSREEMWQMIQMQQKQIEALQSQIQTHDQKIARTETKVEETAKVAETAQKTVANIEPAAGGNGAGNGWWNKTSIGGYGELHYSGGSKDTLDLHRFVVNLNHEFNEDIRLHSEIEIEHALAGDGEAGEVEVEQAYVEFAGHQHRGGLYLPAPLWSRTPWA